MNKSKSGFRRGLQARRRAFENRDDNKSTYRYQRGPLPPKAEDRSKKPSKKHTEDFLQAMAGNKVRGRLRFMEIIKAIADVYPERALLKYVSHTGLHLKQLNESKDKLAAFIVEELYDDFDADEYDIVQLASAERVLRYAIDLMETMIGRLEHKAKEIDPKRRDST